MKITAKMQTQINIPVQNTEYIVGSDLLGNIHTILPGKKTSSFLVLTDSSVFTIFGKIFISSLKKLGKPIIISVIKPGEKQKDITKIPELVSPFFAKGFDRNSCLIAFGGGVVTDLGGFIASILLRGISCVYVPTTLLAQVDASIGGKTGVDFWLSNGTMYKNMLGTFRQPDMVISDADLLKTLPERELKSGLGEIVKYWIGFGKPDIITAHPEWSPIHTSGLLNVISECQKIKLDTIQKDPLDAQGIREKLNLGHTIGHAIESIAGGKLSHGESVVLGLIAAARISTLMGLLDPNIEKEIKDTIRNLGFTSSFKRANKTDILAMLKHDKKGGRFVLIQNISQIESQKIVDKKIIEKAIEEICF